MTENNILEYILDLALDGEADEVGFTREGTTLVWPSFNSKDEEEGFKYEWSTPWVHNWNNHPVATAVWLMDEWMKIDQDYDDELVQWYHSKKPSIEVDVSRVPSINAKKDI